MATLIVVIIIIVGLAVGLLAPQLLLRRAASQVIKIFLKQNIANPQSARMPEELNLQQQSYVQRMVSLRDYKPAALDMLVKAGIIISMEDGKLYLSEQELMNTSLGRRLKPPGL